MQLVLEGGSIDNPLNLILVCYNSVFIPMCSPNVYANVF